MSNERDQEQRQGRRWDPEEVVRGMATEQAAFGEESNFDTAERIIQENLPFAVQSIVHLALMSDNEKMRFDASKYLVDRAIGRVDEKGLRAREDDPIAKLMADSVSSPDKY